MIEIECNNELIYIGIYISKYIYVYNGTERSANMRLVENNASRELDSGIYKFL